MIGISENFQICFDFKILLDKELWIYDIIPTIHVYFLLYFKMSEKEQKSEYIQIFSKWCKDI